MLKYGYVHPRAAGAFIWREPGLKSKGPFTRLKPTKPITILDESMVKALKEIYNAPIDTDGIFDGIINEVVDGIVADVQAKCVGCPNINMKQYTMNRLIGKYSTKICLLDECNQIRTINGKLPWEWK